MNAYLNGYGHLHWCQQYTFAIQSSIQQHVPIPTTYFVESVQIYKIFFCLYAWHMLLFRAWKFETRAIKNIYLESLSNQVYRSLVQGDDGVYRVKESRHVTFDENSFISAPKLEHITEEEQPQDESIIEYKEIQNTFDNNSWNDINGTIDVFFEKDPTYLDNISETSATMNHMNIMHVKMNQTTLKIMVITMMEIIILITVMRTKMTLRKALETIAMMKRREEILQDILVEYENVPCNDIWLR